MVHQFLFPGFSNVQYKMYTLKTGNLFIQCGSQNLEPHKGNKKSCLRDALFIL